jgi:3-hydroxyacyl-[acyl-carrier-protein] dehydratase
MRPIFLRQLFDYRLLGRTPQGARVRVRLNPDHAIYDGHFPGNPITPGVCSLQIVEEVVADLWGRSLRLIQLDWIKYLAFIDPRQHPEIDLELQFDKSAAGWQVTGQLERDQHCFVKLRARYQ